MYTIYLIDGVRAPKKVWERRQLFGEHSGAKFWKQEVELKRARFAQPRY